MLPLRFDGAGPMPSLYWGSEPAPSLVEYYRRQSHFDFVYLIPYLFLGMTVTVAGYVVAPLLLNRFKRLSTRPSSSTAIVTLLLLLALSLAGVMELLRRLLLEKLTTPQIRHSVPAALDNTAYKNSSK